MNRTESGLTDEDFSPIWADDDRPRSRAWPPSARRSRYLEHYRATVEMKCRDVPLLLVAAHDLDHTARPLDWYGDVDLRWLVLRMITEYAQHCGHVDLLREWVDVRTGA